jgi:hypothetical protein
MYLGSKSIDSISSQELLVVLKKIETKGLLETARRTKQRWGQVFRHGIGLGYCPRDITVDMRGLFEAPIVGEIDPLSQQSYDKILESHLDDYRRGRLSRIESGVFVKNGVERPYGHILPADLKWLNILEPFRSEVMQYQIANSLRLHRDFHHLNSSQAFAFNLFIPLSQHALQKLATVLTAILLGPQNSPVAGGPAGGKERNHPTVCRRPRRGLDLGVAGLNPAAIPQNTTELRIWSCWSPSQSRRLPRDRVIPLRDLPRCA